MRLRGTSHHRALASLVVTAMLAAGAACSRSDASEHGRIPPSTMGRGQDSPILAPPSTTAFPTTTLPLLPVPVAIPRDSYAPEPVTEIGTIEIPAIGLVHPIYQGVTLHNIDLGPSHWTGTAQPGQPGNTVFAAHRVTNTHPFRDIDQLVEGDEVIFTVAGVRSVYRVTGSMVVGPADSWIANQTQAFTGTLYACHPPGSLAYRYVVKLALAS